MNAKTYSKLLPLLLSIVVFLAMCLIGCQPASLQGRFRSVIQVQDGRAIVLFGVPTLIDMESGERIIPAREFAEIIRMCGDMVLVSEYGVAGIREYAIIDIESREEIIPFGKYDSIRLIGEGFAVIGDREENPYTGRVQIVDRAVIDIASEEIVFQLNTNEILSLWGRSVSNGLVVVDSTLGRGVVDLNQEQGHLSETSLIRPGRYGNIGNIYDGLAVIAESTIPRIEGTGVVELSSGRELIPQDTYRRILMMQDGLAVVEYLHRFSCERGDCSSDDWCDEEVSFGGFVKTPPRHRCGWYSYLQGVIDIVRNKEVVPIGKWDEIGEVVDGIAVIYIINPIEDEPGSFTRETALIEIDSGEIIVPPGVYGRINLFEDGVVALFEKGGGRFDTIESLRSYYALSE